MFLLETGLLPDGDFAGSSMSDVIEDNTGKLTPGDREAIAAYLKSLPKDTGRERRPLAIIRRSLPRELRHTPALHPLLHCRCQSNKNKGGWRFLLPTRLIPVNCAQLQLGMYVAELDRSWLQTPFHAHGFLLSQGEQIEELRRVCELRVRGPGAVRAQDGDGEMFYTGLTRKVRPCPAGDLPTPLARQRTELRALGHAFAAAVQGLRRSEESRR